jgi:Sucrose synthase
VSPQALRPRAGSWLYLRLNVDELTVDEISAGLYLAFKEQLAVPGGWMVQSPVQPRPPSPTTPNNFKSCSSTDKSSMCVCGCVCVCVCVCVCARARARVIFALPCAAGGANEAERNPFQVLEIDMAPFNRTFPRLNMAQSIGQGVTFLNRHLSSSMFQVGCTGAAMQRHNAVGLGAG